MEGLRKTEGSKPCSQVEMLYFVLGGLILLSCSCSQGTASGKHVKQEEEPGWGLPASPPGSLSCFLQSVDSGRIWPDCMAWRWLLRQAWCKGWEKRQTPECYKLCSVPGSCSQTNLLAFSGICKVCWDVATCATHVQQALVIVGWSFQRFPESV